jgi:hypothetical protein
VGELNAGRRQGKSARDPRKNLDIEPENRTEAAAANSLLPTPSRDTMARSCARRGCATANTTTRPPAQARGVVHRKPPAEKAKPMMNIHLKLPLVALATGSLIVASCGQLGNTPGVGNLTGAACPELGSGAMNANFTGDAKANGTIRAFVQASGELAKVSAEVEADVTSACQKMGKDLGIHDDQMAERKGAGGKAEGACAPVAARIDAIMKEGAKAQIHVTYTPPECRVEGDAYSSCAGQCDVNVDPGYVTSHCEPGKLSGQCEGTCGGECDGSCNGDCTGECSAKDASGKCAGHCKGTCHGKCEATCHAKCEGQWKAPRCEVDAKAPTADAKCNASCKAHADISAKCSEGKVNAKANLNTGDIGKLVATLEANLPLLLRAQIGYGKRVAGDVQALVQVGADLPSVVGNAGAHAAACIGASADAVVRAQASLKVSVQVSASVSGKVTST